MRPVPTSALAVLVVLVGMPTLAAEVGSPPGFGWMADLAGGCWTGTLPDGKTTDTQCYSWQYGTVLRGTIAIALPGHPPFLGDSVFTVDLVGKLAYVHWDGRGRLSRGEGTVEGDRLVFLDPVVEGKPAVRSVWTRVAGGHRVARETQDGTSWKEMFAVTYRRAEEGGTGDLLALEKRIMEAIRTRDRVALEAVVAEDFVLRAPGADDVGRAAFLDGVAATPGTIESVEGEGVKVTVIGDLGIVTGTQVARVRLPGQAEPVTGRGVFTDVFRRDGGAWKLVLAHTVEMP